MDEPKALAKLEVKIGRVRFKGEGDQEWLAQQLEKVVKVAPEIPDETPATSENEDTASASTPSGDFSTSLASYIRSKSAEGNQTLRFLVTADWLRRRGTRLLTTASVSKALVDNQQSRLANPADCLNKNVAKGYCEKTKDGFFITPEGLKELGHN